jgi:carbon storage regulator
MLVLTRRSQQSIMIGSDIVITVLDVRGDQVRIGVTAPRDVVVHRDEVFAELGLAGQPPASSPREAPETPGPLRPEREESGRADKGDEDQPE